MYTVTIYEADTNKVLYRDEYLSKAAAEAAYKEDTEACTTAGIQTYGYICTE